MAGLGPAKYVVVRERLADRIGKLDAGDQLPSEAALCDEYGVSRITLRRAVEDLIGEGLLVREQGRGTFVTEPSPPEMVRETFANRVIGFYRQQSMAGNHVDTIVQGNVICQNPQVARRLGCPPPTDLIQLDRLRRVNGVIQQRSTTWLKASDYARVLIHDFSAGSLYEFLEQSYGVHLSRNDLLVKITLATDDVAHALHTVPGEPLLTMNSTVFDPSDKPVAYGITYFAPTSGEIVISLQDFGPNSTQVSASLGGPMSEQGDTGA